MKTSELTGAALDWAVAKCECVNLPWFMETYGKPIMTIYGVAGYCASTNWDIGGPIIEREHISVRRSDGQWVAEWWPDNSGMAKKPAQRFVHNRQMVGPTALIAAMRCFVSSRLGDEVDIPEELQ